MKLNKKQIMVIWIGIPLFLPLGFYFFLTISNYFKIDKELRRMRLLGREVIKQAILRDGEQYEQKTLNSLEYNKKLLIQKINNYSEADYQRYQQLQRQKEQLPLMERIRLHTKESEEYVKECKEGKYHWLNEIELTHTKEELQEFLDSTEKEIQKTQDRIHKNWINRIYRLKGTSTEMINKVLSKRGKARIKLIYVSLFVLVYISLFSSSFFFLKE